MTRMGVVIIAGSIVISLQDFWTISHPGWFVF